MYPMVIDRNSLAQTGPSLWTSLSDAQKSEEHVNTVQTFNHAVRGKKPENSKWEEPPKHPDKDALQRKLFLGQCNRQRSPNKQNKWDADRNTDILRNCLKKLWNQENYARFPGHTFFV